MQTPPPTAPAPLMLLLLMLLVMQRPDRVQPTEAQPLQLHQRQLRHQPLSREEKLFLSQGIHVLRYNLSAEDALHSVTVSQRALLANRQSYTALRRLMKRSLFHSFLRSLANLQPATRPNPASEEGEHHD